MDRKIVQIQTPELEKKINDNVAGLRFTKNYRSNSAEEWYLFLPDYQDPRTNGAAGKAIIHYDLFGNRDVFINTTIIYDDPKLFAPEVSNLVYAISDEVVNRLVGFADTLLSVHAGENSYDAEYVRRE